MSDKLGPTINELPDILSRIEEVIHRIDADLINDRSRFDNIQAAIEGLTAQVKILGERLPRTEARMKDAAHDAMVEVAQPVIDMVDNMTPKNKKKKKLLGFI